MDFSYGGLINAWFTLYILASPFWWPKQIRLVRNQTKLRYVIRMVCFDYSTFLYLDDPRVFDSLRRIEKKKVLLKINVSLVHIAFCYIFIVISFTGLQCPDFIHISHTMFNTVQQNIAFCLTTNIIKIFIELLIRGFRDSIEYHFLLIVRTNFALRTETVEHYTVIF